MHHDVCVTVDSHNLSTALNPLNYKILTMFSPSDFNDVNCYLTRNWRKKGQTSWRTWFSTRGRWKSWKTAFSTAWPAHRQESETLFGTKWGLWKMFVMFDFFFPPGFVGGWWKSDSCPKQHQKHSWRGHAETTDRCRDRNTNKCCQRGVQTW